MIQRRCTIALTVALLATGLAGAQSLEGILTKAYEARGGLDRIKSVESARMTGKFVVPGMMEAPIILEWKRPDKLRLDLTTDQGVIVQGYDGETAWAIPPGMSAPVELSGEQADAMRQQADWIDGPLVDWKDKGNSVEYLGEDELEGVAVHKIKLVQPDETETTIYLDADSFLNIRQNGVITMQGAETEFDAFIGDYREVGGLMMAHNRKTELIDFGQTRNLLLESIELNVEIADDRFAMPEAAPAAADEADEAGEADEADEADE